MYSAGFLREILAMDVSQVIETVDCLVMDGRELSQLAADFTWYLRNLLLVKCSDNMEDVLDVSSENLAQLKEEAGMIENETLIRYIRVFSDLTNQLRYSTQKRVLLEVTLIRLCRPAMEQTEDALLDRIRMMEKQIEEMEEEVRSAPRRMQEYPDDPEEIRRLIEEKIGKQIEVEVRSLERGGRFEDSFVDLEKLIHMEITVED